VAQNIIRSLCTVDRSRRLGNISGGTRAVKSHPFFTGIDWPAIVQRRVRPPIQPRVRFPGDAQCFDTYPEDDGNRAAYTEEQAERYDGYFTDF
jgi:protein kinase A